VRLFSYDLAGAEASATRALELSPTFAETRDWYGLFVLGMARGRWSESIEQSTRALNDDPLSTLTRARHAVVLAMAGRAEEGIPHALSAVAHDPESAAAFNALMSASIVAGQAAQAVVAGHAALRLTRRSPYHIAYMAAALEAWGEQPDALEALFHELSTRASTEYVQATMLAWAATGRSEEALSEVERAFEEREPILLLAVSHLPGAESLRATLRAADRLDELRSRLGLG